MKLRFVGIIIVFCILMVMTTGIFAEDGAWKTTYFKRGFVGNYNANWGGGVGATLRMRAPMQFDGTKVKIFTRGCWDAESELTKMSLIKGVDNNGKITGDAYPVLFAGTASLKLEKGLKTADSEEITIPITKGIWYIQSIFSSQYYPYAYEVDHGFCEAGENFTKETLAKKVTTYAGIVYRIDVFTTDTRPTILCYGDSITAGYNSTPNTDNRYPAILGKLIDRPVLNLGQNGDLVQHSNGVPGAANSLRGVDTVIYMMGINDIIGNGAINSVKTYSDTVKSIIGGCHASKKKIYIGTIPPAGGFVAFDKDPAKEILRKDINTWIRQINGADGVIDFDIALADPDDPSKMKTEYQSDKLHPNDKGYQKMAEIAAKVFVKIDN
jgi:lysophospholipase L1-like esterase